VKVAFLGSPVEALPSLSGLHAAGHEIVLVITQPDRRRGRGAGTDPSPVKRRALELGLPVITPEKCKEALGDITASGAEIAVVVAFGQLIPQSVLDAVPHGFINSHFSLLPRWRGAAPVERAMLAGDEETGVCLMLLEKGLDTGPVYVREAVTIGEEETAGELRARLAELGARLLVEHLPQLPKMEAVVQEGEPTYAHKLETEEFELDWSRPAAELSRVVRAGNPKPGAFTAAGGKRLKVLRAHPDTADVPEGAAPGALAGKARVVTGDGILVLDEVQPETKAAMPGTAWAAGFRDDHLGT
jgi:methionyl-tRNA formyltransferase